MKHESRIIVIFDVPDDIVETVETTMKRINLIVVRRHIVSSVIEDEFSSADPVRHRADASAEETFSVRIGIFPYGPAAKNDVFFLSVFVRGEDRYDPASEISSLEHDVSSLEGVQFHRNVVDGRVEILCRKDIGSLLLLFLLSACSHKENCS